MKKHQQNISKVVLILLLTFNFQFLTFNSFAQSPQSFQYQAVVRDASGAVLVNQSVNFQLSIISGTLPGTIVYVETHNSATTNTFGIVTLAVGSGTPVTNLFSDIDWSISPCYLKVEVNPGTGLIDMGTTQLLSVPYALYSEKSGNLGDTVWSKSGNNIFNNNSGNVGIGITNPSYQLHINNASGASSAKIGNLYSNFDNRLFFGDGSYVYIGEENFDDQLSIKAGTMALNLVSGGGFGTSGQVLKSNGTTLSWQNENSNTYSASNGLTLTGNDFSAQTTMALWNANKLQGKDISIVVPNIGQFLGWNGTAWAPTSSSSVPGGLNKTIQFNNSGVFGGDTSMIWDNTNKRLGVGLTNPNGRMVIRGSSTALITEPLFEVKNASGQTVFVVYPDSVHIYVKDDGTKSNQGGFAVSGRSNSKPVTNNYLNVTPDQTRIYTGDPVLGFGVGDVGTGTAISYMHLTPQNYLIGHNAGDNLQFGLGFYNLLLGYQAGKNLYSGSSNICIGYQSGFSGYNFMNENILLGNYAGFRTNSTSNIFIGNEAGYNNIKGDDNIYIGNQAGYTSLGYDSVPGLSYHAMNTIIGSKAGKSLATLQGNTIIGASACENSTNSIGSTIIGSNACLDGNLTYSTVIGMYAGASATGTENIYIGGSCGRLNIGSNNVFMGNSIYSYASDHLNNKFILKSGYSNIHPLLFGDFYFNQLVVNGDSSDNTTSLNFFVNGTAGGLFAWSNVSDKKFKKNIEIIANPLDKVKKLRGVNFEWNDPKKFESGIQMGFIAQEVEEVIPEVVRVKDGNYAMQYAPITALLVEAIKEQQKQIEDLKAEIEKIKIQLNASVMK